MVVLKEQILTVSTLGWCGGPEKSVFFTFSTLGWAGGPERTDF